MKTTHIEQIMLLALENVKEGITITDYRLKDNPLIYVNKGFCLITGYKKEEVVGKNCRFLQGSKTDKASVKKIRAAIENEESIQQEILNFKKDGTPFWNRVSLTPIFDDSNVLSHFIGIQEDITVSKEKEMLLRKISNQKLVNKTIIIAEEKQKREIGAEIHDNINQILTSIKLCLYIASKQEDLKTEMLLKSDLMLEDVMDEIRKLSKKLVGPNMIQETLQAAVSELISSMQLIIPFSIEFVYEEGIEKNLSETMKLTFYRIIQEQLNNIIKHAQSSAVKINFSMDDAMIHLSLKDDGVGFNEKITPTGIGIKNIKHRVEMEDGKFTILTSVGNGCEIKVDLPY